MSCRHDLAVGTCVRCYPSNPYGRSDRDRVDPGPEDEYEPNLEGPGACTCPPMWPLEYGSGRHHPKCPQRVAGSDSINHPESRVRCSERRVLVTSVQLYCQQCSYEAKRPLLEQVACRGIRETACEPALCPQGHGPMLRKDGVVQQRIREEWVVTGQGIDRSRYVYEGPNGAVRPNSEHSPNERLRVTLEDRFNYAVTRKTTP